MATKATKQPDAMKWLEKCTATPSENRPVLTAGHVSKNTSYTANGYALHMVWEELPNADGWITFKKTDADATTGRFPDVWQVLPDLNNAAHVAMVDAATLRHAVKLASIFARDLANSVRLSFVDDVVFVSARSFETGDIQTAVTATSGVNVRLDVSYNATYLMNALDGFNGVIPLHIVADGINKGEAAYKLVIGGYGERTAMLMSMTVADASVKTTPFAPDMTLIERLDAKPASTSKRKTSTPKSAKPAKQSEAPEIVTKTTDDDGTIHERVEYRRGAAAFADVIRRDSPEQIAERAFETALSVFEEAVRTACYTSKDFMGSATVLHRPEQGVIMIAVKHTPLHKEAYAIRYDGLRATVTHYTQSGSNPPFKYQTSELAYPGRALDIWQITERIAARYTVTDREPVAV